ncbi:hypothetical protein [Kitasatospora sp. NPDC088346]|uniref:hypothetical protein n=1 Tax=Kitasatospora sp. NPDC088346 TaxID=3364073 RepID=UPI00381C2450
MMEREGHRRAGKAVVLACLTPILLAFVAVAVVAGGLLTPAPGQGEDLTACSTSFREIDQTSGYFGLTLPADATALRHDTVEHPLFGDRDLMVTFTTTTDGLREFLHTGGLPAPAPAPGSAPVTGCGAHTGAAFTQAVRKGDGQHVTVQVYADDPARPRVVLRASDD